MPPASSWALSPGAVQASCTPCICDTKEAVHLGVQVLSKSEGAGWKPGRIEATRPRSVTSHSISPLYASWQAGEVVFAKPLAV